MSTIELLNIGYRILIIQNQTKLPQLELHTAGVVRKFIRLRKIIRLP